MLQCLQTCTSRFPPTLFDLVHVMQCLHHEVWASAKHHVMQITIIAFARHLMLDIPLPPCIEHLHTRIKIAQWNLEGPHFYKHVKVGIWPYAQISLV